MSPPGRSDRAETTGQFCRLFAPASGSPASLAFSPSLPRSIPSATFSNIELPSIALLMPLITVTPSVPLKAMMFREPAEVPPIRLLPALSTLTP